METKNEKQKMEDMSVGQLVELLKILELREKFIKQLIRKKQNEND
jgi:hypothetical protein